jgi:membrane protease YdiL (CAAX protease family)
MSFVSATLSRRLSEKPWRTDAVARLVMSVILGVLAGAIIATVIRYFETPQTSSVSAFLGIAAGALAVCAAAIFILSRPEGLANVDFTKVVLLVVFIYASFGLTWWMSRFITGGLELKHPVFTLLISAITFQGFALLLVHFFLREHSTGWREGFGFSLHPGQSMMIGVGIGILVLYPVLILLDTFCFYIFQHLALQPQQQQAVEILRHTGTLLARAASCISTVFLVPIGEEVIFRGILYPWAKRCYSQRIALWGTAIFFGVIHFNLSSFLPLTLMALVLVWLYEYTGNLLAPIAAHCAFNGVSFILLFIQQNQLPPPQ